MNRATILRIVALIFGALTVFTVGASSSSAQTTFTPNPTGVGWDDPYVTKEEAFRLKKLFSQPSRPETSRSTVTKAARTKLPGLSRGLLMRGGLAGAAAGIWVHNGIMLWNVNDCGSASCPAPLILNAQFRHATDTTGGAASAANAISTAGPKSDPNAIRVVTNISYEPYLNTSGVASARITSDSILTNKSTWTGSKTTGNYGLALPPVGTDPATSVVHVPSTVGTGEATQVVEVVRPTAPELNFYTRDWISGTEQPYEFFGQPFSPSSPTTWQNPVFDWGPATVVATPPPVTHEYGQGASTEFANEIGRTGCPTGVVATPEAPTAPEVCPDFFPAEWEEEWEDELQPAPGESPYADPDEDGIPNHADPDDDGDEIPDEEDDLPFLPAPESPAGDPDEDGIPNRDDPDQDNDGIPNEDDPEPFVPTDPATLPQDHPYADPDEDGIPNRTDPDQDNDGIPNEDDPEPFTPTAPADLPRDNPYADPDDDGIPNKDDPDQDDDGIPNEDDPEPFDPTAPEDLPRYHPYADPDTDGSPNRKDKNDDNDLPEDWEDKSPWNPEVPGNPDRDTDTDGVPDWSDPWPGNPHAPKDPGRDSDTDGIPDYKDPEIGITWIPWGNPEDTPDAPDRRDRPSDDPDVPSNPSTPPWGPKITPETPGTPYVPVTPGNPASPPYAPSVSNPPDLSTGISNPPPTRPDVPDDPTTTDTPDTPPGGPGGGGSGETPPTDPPDQGGTCPPVAPAKFELPDVELANVFPFSLVLRFWDLLGELVQFSTATPSIAVPGFGEITPGPTMDYIVKTCRALLAVVLNVGMGLWFYRYITGRGSE